MVGIEELEGLLLSEGATEGVSTGAEDVEGSFDGNTEGLREG